MLSGWVRYLRLTVKARTGISPAVVVFGLVAGICSATAFVLFVFAAFIWLANEYTPLTAALVLSLFFLLIAILAGLCALILQRRTVERATVALESRSNTPWLDPSMLGILLQVGRTIGLRRILPLVAAGFLAAGFAREWMRDRPTDEAATNEDEES